MLCEEIKAFLEIRPEPDQIGLISVSGGELVQSGGGSGPQERSRWEPRISSVDGEPVNLLDAIVGDRNTADGDAVPVQENVAAQVLFRAEDAVGSVWIADMKAQIEIALRIEPIEFIEALGNLYIAEAAFRAETPEVAQMEYFLTRT
jgi:hypothetical protein